MTVNKRVSEFYSWLLLFIFVSNTIQMANAQGISSFALKKEIPGTRSSLVVDISGNGDHMIIQEAIDAADNETVITIKPGIYNERLMINKSLQLDGMDAHDVIIECEGTGNAIEISSDGVVITELTVRNKGQLINGDGILISGSNNCTIRNCIVEDTATGIILTTNGTRNCSGCLIRENSVGDNKKDGVYIKNGSRNSVEKNTFRNNKYFGIRLEGGFGNSLVSNTLDGNDGGISISGASGIRLFENSLRNMNEAIYIVDSTNNRIEGNTCRDNWAGIYMVNSHNNTILGNTCNDGGHSGIYMDTSNNNSIENNACDNNDGTGIYITNSYYNVVSNNTCRSNIYHGIFVDDDGSLNNTLTNNIITEREPDDGTGFRLTWDLVMIIGIVVILLLALLVRFTEKKEKKKK